MINIIVCDDDKYMTELVENAIVEYMSRQQIECDLKIYNSGKKLIEDNVIFDILFLDIEMPEMDGFQVAKYYYDTMGVNMPKIAFFTSYDGFMKKAFSVNAYRYISKIDYESEISECLDSYIREFVNQKVHTIMVNGNEVVIEEKNIMHINSTHNGSEVWTINSVIECKYSVKKWVSLLDSNLFIAVSGGNVVNLAFVDYIGSHIFFFNGEKVKYSKRNKKEIERRLHKYILTYV